VDSSASRCVLTWLDLRTDRERVFDAFFTQVANDFLAQNLDKTFGHWRNLGTKANEPSNSRRIGHSSLILNEFKPNENVAGKERFDPPDLSSARRFPVTEAGTKHFNSLEFLQMSGSNVLALRLRFHTIPVWGVIGVRHWPRTF
jgi:hypothetical protein